MKCVGIILSLMFSLVAIAHTMGGELPPELESACTRPPSGTTRNILLLNLVQPVESFASSVEVVFSLDTADCIEGEVQPASVELERALITNPEIPGFSQIAVLAKLSRFRYVVQVNLPTDFIGRLSQSKQKFNVSVEFKNKAFPYCLLAENGKFSLKKLRCP